MSRYSLSYQAKMQQGNVVEMRSTTVLLRIVGFKNPVNIVYRSNAWIVLRGKWNWERLSDCPEFSAFSSKLGPRSTSAFQKLWQLFALQIKISWIFVKRRPKRKRQRPPRLNAWCITRELTKLLTRQILGGHQRLTWLKVTKKIRLGHVCLLLLWCVHTTTSIY